MGVFDEFICDCGAGKKCVCMKPPDSKYPPLRPPFPWEEADAPNIVAPYDK
jgi:hypothetical protein